MQVFIFMRKLFKTLYISAGLITCLVIAMTNPVWVNAGTPTNEADSLALKKHVRFLSEISPARSHENIASLDSCAAYIKAEFEKYADTTWYQEYEVNGKKYRNVVCSFGSNNEERIVVGAHYDVCNELPGADDNASGTAGLLEIARLLKLHEKELKNRYDLVAYTLEEPPFFRKDEMGSMQHVKYLKENNIKVKSMVCLEMIGYYNEEKKSQKYPFGLLKLFYPSEGNYITVIGKMSNWNLTRKMKKNMKKNCAVKVCSLNGFSFVPGIDLSDHRSYWKEGISAVMITNTAFFRNFEYHTKNDTWDRLNYVKMSEVVNGVLQAILKL